VDCNMALASPSSIGECNVAAPAAARHSNGQEPQAPPYGLGRCNPGSVGHPELCLRPCLFQHTRCANGLSCNFCHMPHPKRPSHLDKRHREMLREMSYGRRAAIVMPILRAKVSSIDASPEAAVLVEQLANAWSNAATAEASDPAPTQEVEERPQWRERALFVALRSLSLRLLLQSMCRSITPESGAAAQAMEHLLAHLHQFSLKNALKEGMPMET